MADKTQTPTFPFSDDARIQEMLALWGQFCGALRPENNIGIVYHADVDGVVGGAFVNHILRFVLHLPKVRLYWVATEEYSFDSLKEWVKSQALTHCVFLDVAIENSPDDLLSIAQKVDGQVFIYDHHVVSSSHHLPPRTLLANPTLIDGKSENGPLPTFAFANALANEHGVPFPEWLLVLSIFAEGVDQPLTNLASSLLAEHFGYDGSVPIRDFYRSSVLVQISSFVRAGFEPATEKHQGVLEALEDVIGGKIRNASELADVLGKKFGEEASRLSSTISQKIDYWKEQIRKPPLRDAKLVVMPIDSTSGSVAGPVASVVRGEFPDKVMAAIVKTIEGIGVVELRTGKESGLNLADVLSRVAKTVPLINHGGHPNAAGALMKYEQRDNFFAALEAEILNAGE